MEQEEKLPSNWFQTKEVREYNAKIWKKINKQTALRKRILIDRNSKKNLIQLLKFFESTENFNMCILIRDILLETKDMNFNTQKITDQELGLI